MNVLRLTPFPWPLNESRRHSRGTYLFDIVWHRFNWPLNDGFSHDMDTYLILSGFYRSYQVVKTRPAGARVTNCFWMWQGQRMWPASESVTKLWAVLWSSWQNVTSWCYCEKMVIRWDQFDKMGPAGVSVTRLWLDVTKSTKAVSICQLSWPWHFTIGAQRNENTSVSNDGVY
jgi:hypothetical protein